MRFNIQPQKNRLPKQHTIFTHYSNSIYMGQMKAFKRQGKGILLHDNGLCGIVNSTNNSFRGHNILIGQNSIISINFISQDCQIVYKNGKNILICKLKRINRQMVIDGIGYLIEFDLQKVYKIIYSNNQLLEKILLDYDIAKEIFQNNNLTVVMKQPHISALQMVFQTHPQIKINREGDQIKIGFRKRQEISKYLSTYKAEYGQSFNNCSKDSPLEGVGVRLKILNYEPDKPFQLQFKIKQRGIYEDGKLQFFGQKYFPNENFYYGQIKDQKMHGMGLLLQKKQNKWMPGIFQDDKFIQTNLIVNPLKQQTIQNFYYLIDESDKKKLQKFYKELHSQDPKIWIDQNINSLPSQQYLLQLLNILKSEIFTSTQAQKKMRKLQKSLKLQKLLIDVSVTQSERSSPKSYRFNNNSNNYNNQQIQQISNPLINNNNFKEFHLQDSLQPVIQQSVNPGMEISFGPRKPLSNKNRLLQKIKKDNEQLQRDYTSPSEQQTIINQIRSSHQDHQEINHQGLSDKNIIDFNKLAHQTYKHNEEINKNINQRVSWFIPSGDFQTKYNKFQHKSRSKSNEKNRSSKSSYKDSLEKLKQKNLKERVLRTLQKEAYSQKKLQTQAYRKPYQNQFQKQRIFTPPKQSRQSRSPYRSSQTNEILANTYHSYHTPVGKLYTRQNTNYNYNSSKAHQQDELNSYKQHLEAMNLLAHRLSKQKQQHSNLSTNQILLNHLIIDENIKKYGHKTHKKHFNYLDAKDEQINQRISPYKHSRRSRQKSPYIAQQRAHIFNQDRNALTKTSTSPYRNSIKTSQKQYIQKPYSQRQKVNHSQQYISNNAPFIFDSKKEQNTPLKDLGKLITKTYVQKDEIQKKQDEKKFIEKMRLKEQNEKSHFIKDNAIFWSDGHKK